MFRRNIPFRKPQKPCKLVKCKGYKFGTNIKYDAELCQTDGEFLYVTFGRIEIAMQAERTDYPFLVCSECGYETLWRKGNT